MTPQNGILQADGRNGQALLPAVQVLLEGMGQRSIEGDPDDLAVLRAILQELSGSLGGDLSVTDLLAKAEAALHALEEYNRRTAQYWKRPCGEWQAVVTMLTSAVAAMAEASAENIRRWRAIAAGVRTAVTSEEVHKIRLHLSECLTAIQLEMRHPKAEPARALSAGPPAPPVAADPITGFAMRPQAVEALTRAWQTDPVSYVVVMVLDRLQIFNMRFGHAVGDEVFRYYSEFVRKQYRPGDQIFRWSGPALVALLPRPARLEIVREEVARLMDSRCEHTVQTVSRTILLPITARWTVFPPMAAPRLLTHKIDAFTAAHSLHGNAE